MNIKDRLFVATMAKDAAKIAEKYGIGIEIDEFCTAVNMEGENFEPMDQDVKKKMASSHRHILHAPFNELFPAAIDPLALKLAHQRYNQSYELARRYGISRMVVHSGYVPYVYVKCWFLWRSADFWKRFMDDKPDDFHIMIENVLEDEPYTLSELISNIDDRRVTACLDIGHANCFSVLDLTEWVETMGPCLGHVHIHNNNKSYDAHAPLGEGNIDMNLILNSLMQHASANITYTVENMECTESLKWLAANGWIGESEEI